KLLVDLGVPIHKIEEAGIMLPVVSVKCNYKTPAKMGDMLRVVTTIDKLPMAKIVAKAQIFNQQGLLICDGEVIVGFIKADTRKPTRAPKILMDTVSKHF
ncbi:MAG: hotdog domain-containing protein, partial [Bacteroidales bacterium]